MNRGDEFERLDIAAHRAFGPTFCGTLGQSAADASRHSQPITEDSESADLLLPERIVEGSASMIRLELSKHVLQTERRRLMWAN